MENTQIEIPQGNRNIYHLIRAIWLVYSSNFKLLSVIMSTSFCFLVSYVFVFVFLTLASIVSYLCTDKWVAFMLMRVAMRVAFMLIELDCINQLLLADRINHLDKCWKVVIEVQNIEALLKGVHSIDWVLCLLLFLASYLCGKFRPVWKIYY